MISPIDGEFRDSSIVFALLKDTCSKMTEDSLELMPFLLSFLKHDDHAVVRQSIATGTSLFCAVLEEMTLQFLKSNKVERWLTEVWNWMVKFKDAIYEIASEPGSVGTKVLAVKFLEVSVLLFTSDGSNTKFSCAEDKGKKFNVSWLADGHPTLNPSVLESEANKALDFLIDILLSPLDLRGSFIVAVVNCLAAIARNRPIYFDWILSALIDLVPNLENLKGCHVASIQYSVRTSLLGFVKSTHPEIMNSRDKVLKTLRAMNLGEATDRVIRQLEKMPRCTEPITIDVRSNKDNSTYGLLRSEDSKQDATITRFDFDAQSLSDCAWDDGDNGSRIAEAERMIAVIGALVEGGESCRQSLDNLISSIHSDLMADIVILNMNRLSSEDPMPLCGSYQSLPVNSQAGSSIKG